MITANDFISDNLTKTGPDRGSSSLRRRILRAPFTRRTWAELAYSVSSLLLAVGALVFIVLQAPDVSLSAIVVGAMAYPLMTVLTLAKCRARSR